MGMFDASNRDQCEVRRGRTNTPLQALAMLNDPTVLEAARVLAQRLEAETAAANDEDRKGISPHLCRKPTAGEMTTLAQYYQEELADFRTTGNARKTLAVGEYPQATGVDPIATAALMRVIEILYNLEETITRT